MSENGIKRVESVYYCDVCNKKRKLKISQPEHLQLISISSNGLVPYTDIHLCGDGLSGVTNIHIDGDFNVRTLHTIKLPQKKKSLVPSPKMTPSLDTKKLIQIYNLPFNQDLFLVIEDNLIQQRIEIGRLRFHEFPYLKEISSDFGGVKIQLYSLISGNTTYLESWMGLLANSLEILIPTKIGLLIEALKYIVNLFEQAPTEFDAKFMRTILASHEVFIKKGWIPSVKTIADKYPETFNLSTMLNVETLLHQLEESQEISMQDSYILFEKDFIYLIYLLLLLEKEDIIEITRPEVIGVE